jgi:uncharacterized protein (TIGR00369 family)
MTVLNTELRLLAEEIFRAQAFSQALGAELAEVGPGAATIRMPVRPDLLQQHGYVHGGVLSYLADNAIAFAGGLALGGDALTAEFKINYIRPGTGAQLSAKATAIATTRRQSVCHCAVYAITDSGEERLIALAQGTIVGAPASRGSRATSADLLNRHPRTSCRGVQTRRRTRIDDRWGLLGLYIRAGDCVDDQGGQRLAQPPLFGACCGTTGR